MTQIIPSILVQSEDEFRKCLDGLSGAVPHVQLDIADGVFVPNATWGNPDVIRKLKKITVELHLMVANPLSELERWKGVKTITRALFHYESGDDLPKIIQIIQDQGWQAGLVLNPGTPIEVLTPYLNTIQAVQFMGVHPGFQGQEFLHETPGKIQNFKKLGTAHFTELDGGVNEETLPKIIKSGVDAICPGSAVFGNEKSPKENVEKMKTLIENYSKV